MRQSTGAANSSNGTQILAISQGVPVSATSSVYAKGPFTNMSSSSSKYSRLQNSVQRNIEGGGGISSDQGSAGRGARSGALSRSKYIEIDKKNLPSLPIYQLLRAFNL